MGAMLDLAPDHSLGHSILAAQPLTYPKDIVNVRLLQGSRPLTLDAVWEQPFLLPLGVNWRAKPGPGVVCVWRGSLSITSPPSPRPPTSPQPLAIADLSLGRGPG